MLTHTHKVLGTANPSTPQPRVACSLYVLQLSRIRGGGWVAKALFVVEQRQNKSTFVALALYISVTP